MRPAEAQGLLAAGRLVSGWKAAASGGKLLAMRALGLGTCVCLCACAGGGKTWVQEAPRLHAEAPAKGQPHRSSWSLALEDEIDALPPPRRPVITLGQRLDEVDAPAPAAPGSAGTNVVVNVNVSTPSWGYSGYGYGYPWVGFPGSPGWGPDRPDRPDHHPRPEPPGPPATPPLAGDWPASPSYGPAPISHTAPGNPWH